MNLDRVKWISGIDWGGNVMMFNLMWISPCRTAPSPNPHVRMELHREGNTSNEKKESLCVNAIEKKQENNEITDGVRLGSAVSGMESVLGLSTSTPQVSRNR